MESRQSLPRSVEVSAQQPGAPAGSGVDVECEIAAALRLHRAGHFGQAEVSYRQILQRTPNHPGVLNLLGTLNAECGRSDIAVALIGKAIQLDPEVGAYHTNLASALSNQGRLDEAVACYRRALILQPDNRRAHSNLIVTLHHLADATPDALDAEIREWGRRHADPLVEDTPRHPNAPDPERRLRIGYVSGELYRHPIGYFLAPVLDAHDPSQVEVICYQQGSRSDDLTERLRAFADTWRSIDGVGDAEVVDLIRRDQIDVLVDLSWHLGDNRLPVFARKPAPIQASWIGAINSTGVPTIDYLIADSTVWPKKDDQLACETVNRLPETFLTYVPPDPVPRPADPPVRGTGVITFGNFNRVAKMGPNVIALWSELLHQVADARLVLRGSGFADPGVRVRVGAQFAHHGVAAERLRLIGPAPHAEMMRAYAEIDIALDPFPYSGSTTTVEALWMGVPVITLEGPQFAGRTSASFLHVAGLSDLVARSGEAYLERAIALAGDRPRLADLRQQLRSHLERSSLGDRYRFTRDLEAAYRAMWRRWCAMVG